MESVVEFPDGGSLSIELVEQSRNAFNMFDKDGSGRIDLEEMKLAVKHLGCDAEEAEDLFLAMDENCDGEVDFDEFLKVMAFSVRQGDTSFAQSNNSSDAAGSNDPNLVTIPPPNMMEAAMQAFRLFRVNSTRQYRAEGDRAYDREADARRQRFRARRRCGRKLGAAQRRGERRGGFVVFLGRSAQCYCLGSPAPPSLAIASRWPAPQWHAHWSTG